MKPTLLLAALATVGLLASPVAAKPKAKRSGAARIEKPVPQAAEIKALNLKQLAAMERGAAMEKGAASGVGQGAAAGGAVPQ